MAGARLKALDGLRGVAAIGAMLFHAHISVLPSGHGYLAVDLFFMLSGYVIAWSYEPALAPVGGASGIGLWRYMRLRLERLYPMLLLGGLIGLTVFLRGLGEFKPIDQNDVILAIISQFLLIPFLSSDGFFAFNRVQWSISLELLVNMIHAATLRKLGLRVLAGVVLLAAIGLAVSARQCGWLNTVCGTPTFHLLVLSRAFFGFFVGVLLCRTQDRWDQAMPSVSFPLLAIVVLVLLSMPFRAAVEGPGRGLYDFVCVVMLFPLIIMQGAKARAGAWACKLGTMSFPLYAIHLPLIDAMRHGGALEWQAIIGLLGLIVAAWAIGRGIDEPLNAMRRRSRKRRPADASGAAVVGA